LSSTTKTTTACWSEEGLATLMDAGMNVARLNFSHGDHEGHGATLERLRKVAAQKSRNIGTFQLFLWMHIYILYICIGPPR
jgi:pyruvate kinase